MDPLSKSPARGHNVLAWKTTSLIRLKEGTLEYKCVLKGATTTFNFPWVELHHNHSGGVMKAVGVHLTPKDVQQKMLESLQEFSFAKDVAILSDLNLQYATSTRAQIQGDPRYRGLEKSGGTLDAVAAFVSSVPSSALTVNIATPRVLNADVTKAICTDHPYVLRLSVGWGATSGQAWKKV